MPIPPIANESEAIQLLLKGKLTDEELFELERYVNSIKQFEFRPLIKRIFDLNEDYMFNNSSASTGIMGALNKFSNRNKIRRFKKRIRRDNVRESNKVIVAEGDSWFEFPVFLRDIIDWLHKLSDNPVCSMAFGGDWIGNILYEGKYIQELTDYAPEAFLISGGGNDIVGGNRVATLVHKRQILSPDQLVFTDRDETLKRQLSNAFGDAVAHKIVLGKKFINNDFWALMNVMRFQYLLVFKNIENSGKFNDMRIITQGYDFPIPSSNRNIFVNPLRLFLKNGNWLKYPLTIKGYYNPQEQQAIMAAMIHEFNEMLIDVGRKRNNVYHIDCRGLAGPSDWRDEMHLDSKLYRRIAKTYLECINATDTVKRVYRVTDTP